MKNFNWKSPKGIAIISAAAVLVIALAVVLVLVLGKPAADEIVKVPATEEYVYYNPDETKAEADEGMKIDGVLDEDIYDTKNWLYLSNDDAGNHVNIAMTSHFGAKGMYFVFDVTETSPIYVNPERSPVLNSCIELYLAPPYVNKLTQNSIFEIDLMPTGDVAFRKSDGKYGYINVATTNDKMAYLGATTKGGEVNTPECYGYVMELFIPWDYMEWLKIDVEAIKDAHMFVNPAHITSHNLVGTDINVDRYWYFYAQQVGASFDEVTRYFRFNSDGVMGASPLNLQNGDHYTISGAESVLPGMQVPVTIVPDEGYAITSILIDGEEQIHKVAFDENGGVTVYVRGSGTAQTVSAKAEAVSEGKKTLSGKIRVTGVTGDALKGVLVSYIGPTGEKPVAFDADGKFELKDLDQGYYVLKVEKEGFTTLSRGIYLNRDIYTELTLASSVFQVTGGNCWILSDESNGVLYKIGGSGQIISNASYNNFVFETYLRYDKALAEISTAGDYLQQRSGVRILFSNGKYWHIDLLLDNGKYYLQYAKITGDNSIFSWKNMYTLGENDISKYVSEEGIKLTVMRAGNMAAIYLDDNLVVFEELDAEYSALTAQIGMEAWLANNGVWKYPYSIIDSAEVVRPTNMVFKPADTWDISSQNEGIIRKHGVAGNTTWLNSAINSNDITTVARDLSPATKDYSMIYIFEFSNGEQFRVRLNHTDADGKYRIQSMAGSTVFDAWKNHYTLTDAEAQKVQSGGISYRVKVLGTTAYVYLDGKQVCSYDLSVVVATGKPSGIEKTTVKVSLRLDGNLDRVTEIPFTLVELKGTIPEDTNKPAKSIFNPADTWDVSSQYEGIVRKHGVAGNTTWLNSAINSNDITTVARDLSPATKDYSMIYIFEFSNGEQFRVRLNHTDADGKYRIQSMAGSTVFDAWKNHYTLTDAEAQKVQNGGISYRVQILGTTAYVYLDGKQVCSYDLSVVVATGKPSGIEKTTVKVSLRLDGNLDRVTEIPFTLVELKGTIPADTNKPDEPDKPDEPEIPVDPSKIVQFTIPNLQNGTIQLGKATYAIGEEVTLKITPANGYVQKLYINGKPLMIDWKSGSCSFYATEAHYEITGSFVKGLDIVAKDTGRWDTSNHAHGVLHAYYPANNDAWWIDFNGEYKSISIKAKNYLSVENSMDGNGNVGYSQVLRMTLSNGQFYAFRIINDKGTYAFDYYGAGSANGWGNWKNIHNLADVINGEGIDFKLERTGANTLEISINGTVIHTYTMEGVTENDKVVSVGTHHYGNKGEKVTIPFTLEVASN